MAGTPQWEIFSWSSWWIGLLHSRQQWWRRGDSIWPLWCMWPQEGRRGPTRLTCLWAKWGYDTRMAAGCSWTCLWTLFTGRTGTSWPLEWLTWSFVASKIWLWYWRGTASFAPLGGGWRVGTGNKPRASVRAPEDGRPLLKPSPTQGTPPTTWEVMCRLSEVSMLAMSEHDCCSWAIAENPLAAHWRQHQNLDWLGCNCVML